MKIAVVAHLKYPIAEPFSGGLEMHTHLLVSKLSALGHRVTMFACAGSDATDTVVLSAPTSGLDADPTSACTIDAAEHRAYAALVPMLADGAFDIIHFNALHYLPLEHIDRFVAPVVTVLHTPPFDPYAAAVLSAEKRMTCVAVSSSLASQWDRLSSPPIVIENGIDLLRFPADLTAKHDVYAFWSGRIVPEKGLHLAIDAAQRASIPLRIAGPVIDMTYWEQEIEPRLRQDALYIGHLGQEELASVVRHASVVLCTPRWEEPFGLVVAEALACGTPVAAFARGALPQLIDATCGALAPADDVAGLARAIQQCLTLDRRHCRARAEDRFDADLMIARYESLYREMLDRRVLDEDVLVADYRGPPQSPSDRLLDDADAL